ncbi:MAG: hypothetical protein Q9170_000917 [Blastenia crenularia]
MAEGELTYPIKLTFTCPGACPPVFVAGSFTVPGWQPHELEYSVVTSGANATDHQPRYGFYRTFDLPAGTFQYKFRLGHKGDWWVCDGSVETVYESCPKSRAALQAYTRNKTPKATHRNKYENKPMPPTPEASPSPAEKPLTARKNRGYIQPAIPLTSPTPVVSNMKNRAATEPVMPKPLFTSTTTTVNQLRKKYSQSKTKRKSKEDEENNTHRPTSPPLVITPKASQILGLYPVKDNNRATPPVSAPASTNTPDPFRTSTESARGRNVSPSRQVQSTPVPTRRYLQENNLPAPGVPGPEMKQSQSRETSDGSLIPPVLGTSSRKGEIEYVGQHEMQRAPSFAGIIDNIDSPREDEDATGAVSTNIVATENTLRPQSSGEILHPMVYSPSHYAGVWENDPNVGRTLPPFSPFPPHPLSEVDQRTISQTSRDVPFILQRYPGESSHGSGYTHSMQSQRSWAPSGNGNSFAQPDPPSSGAGTTPRFPTHARNNSVPPPPLSYPGFQPSGPLPLGLVQMELNLHHHIETCFSSLMRSDTDNADRTVDKLVRRVESVQERVEKGLKVLKGEVKDVRKEMVNLRRAYEERSRTSESLKESISSLGEKLGYVDKKIDEIGNRHRRTRGDMSESEREDSSAYSQDKASPRRRSESAHNSGSSRPDQRQPYLSGTARTSATTHDSANSGKGRRSTTTNNSGPSVRRSDERGTRQELFAQFGTAKGQTPDIRDHPVYRGVAEGYGESNSPIFQAPDFGQTWYQHAFGPRQQ